jgi:D-glycero-D-manno-heptose 1,7-bisphosphate phosphatase
MKPKLQPAIFLDRDGVINHDPGDYTKSINEFTLLPTVLKTLKIWHDRGYALVLITNQGGLAKGLYTHEAVAEIHAQLSLDCTQAGAPLTAIYYSPHHPDFGASLSRKPGSLMIERACAQFHLDPDRSWMFGDKARDITCAANAGVRQGVLIPVNADLVHWADVPARI